MRYRSDEVNWQEEVVCFSSFFFLLSLFLDEAPQLAAAGTKITPYLKKKKKAYDSISALHSINTRGFDPCFNYQISALSFAGSNSKRTRHVFFFFFFLFVLDTCDARHR